LSRQNDSEDIQTRESKRARFTGEPKRSSALVWIVAVIAVVAVAAAIVYFVDSEGRERTAPPARREQSAPAPAPQSTAAAVTPIEADGEVYRIPLDRVSQQAAFFRAETASGSVPFFAVRDASGEVHVALDACQSCYAAKKGYTQRGAAMQCRNCGLTFPVAGITDMGDRGGCHPISLPAKVEGAAVAVSRAAVEDGAKWF
jgi:uncharacterized membrane protein